MAKKIKFESFRYRFLIAAQRGGWVPPAGAPAWRAFVDALQFGYDKGLARVAWELPAPGAIDFPLEEARFYTRGDSDANAARQREQHLVDGEDPVKLGNEAYFTGAVARVAQAAGFTPAEGDARLATEREFHDAWADGVDVASIDVRRMNEACTAPEMRYITRALGDLRGKRLLDVGCGLGEASVYFALRGADVTSSDLSPGMLDATTRLATLNGVSVTPHLSAAEDLRLPPEARFDVIYAGNLLHHVDIAPTLERLRPHLAEGGRVVTWDPLHYNPVINVYRAMASSVRTPDEHPLKWSDIQLFRRKFRDVETRYFWLTTLAIFLVMALVQRRNPNRERFWKVVVDEGEKWRWLYQPLEAVDRFLLWLVPPLRLLCWNVVIIAR